ncbi:vWA domain-containing protein [Haliovirga abyssi]|uniref:VWFA domain-containing protein n=1 Tax=Haliovirga abyssi TaxID=2996794 RepID=A0AAU9DCS5_9FUSO|nr:vWA domain-containing protein [Haliovirga abyssi]BDU51306.1 hypothetical protein HLVA_18750 [Haliovirga abyssi]
MKKIILGILLFLSSVFSVNLLAVDTDITVKVDMSVLWGNDLPEKVYLFAYNADYSDVNGLTNQSGMPMKGYDKNLKGTVTEQNTAGALELTDVDGDGFYKGTMHYSGNGDTFHTRLYIRGDDPNNSLNTPKYEEYTGPNDNLKKITDTQDFRTVIIKNDGKVLIGTVTNQVELVDGNWETAWENKYIKKIYISEQNITVYKTFDKTIKIYASYNNADDTLRRNVAKYLNWSSSNENIATVSKGKVLGVGAGNAIIKLSRNVINKNINVTVKNIPEGDRRQVIVGKPDFEIVNGDYKIDGVNDYGGNVPYGVNIDENNYLQHFYNIDFWGTAKPFVKSNNFWEYNGGNSRSSILIFKQIDNNSDIETVKFYKKDDISKTLDMKIPVQIKGFEAVEKINSVSFKWNEDNNIRIKYLSTYKEQRIIFRISKIDTDVNKVEFMKGNPLKKIIDGGNLEDFIDNKINYVDFSFDYRTSNSIEINKIKGSYKLGEFELLGFPVGQYRIQLYTLKANDKYLVYTFDAETYFNMPSSNLSGNIRDNKFYINNINSDAFNTINVGFITKTKNDIKITKDDIYYKNNNEIAEENLDKNEKKIINSGNIFVAEDKRYKNIKKPLDVILCLDTSKSMEDKLEKVKQAWEYFEEDLRKNSEYDVKYKLYTFGTKGKDDVWTPSNDWEDNLDLSKINVGSSNLSKEPSDKAIDKAIIYMEKNARSLSSNLEVLDKPTGTIPSNRVIIFITDSNATGEKNSSDLAVRLRMNDIQLIGIGGVKKDKLMLKDDLDQEGEYPNNMSVENEQHYAHLKLIMGEQFKFYQIKNDLNILKLELHNTLNLFNFVKLWNLRYDSPYSVPDGSKRRVLFDIKVNNKYINYEGKDANREYVANLIGSTNREIDQWMISKAKKDITNGNYKIFDKFMDKNYYKKIKAINLKNGFNSLFETEYSYDDISNFELNDNNYGVKWEYKKNTPLTTQTAVMVAKVSSIGNSELDKIEDDLSTTKIATMSSTNKLELSTPTENSDKVTIGWQGDVPNPDEIYNNQKLVFRLEKATNTSNVITNYKWNVYKKENPLNIVDPTIIGGGGQDPQNKADNMIKNFYSETSNYVDFVFEKDGLKSFSAGGAIISFTPGSNLELIGLNLGDYLISVYTVKTGSDGNYKVITYGNTEKFHSDIPDIAQHPMTKNGLFRIDNIDISRFSKIKVNYSTMMPFSIKAPELSNLFVSTNTGITINLQEEHPTATKAIVVTQGALSISSLKVFKYPLDIVLCIDNSGSMQEEIDSVKDGLKGFVNTLTDNGFDVKFNLITFGPRQNTDSTTGIWHKKIEEFEDRYYLGVYKKDGWFGSLDGWNGLINAFENLNATSGFNYGQENSLWAIYYAIKKLKKNGRSIDANGNILNDNSGVIKSKKWIMFLTDENADLDDLPNDYKKKNVVSKLSKEISDNSIALTGIYHVDKKGLTNEIYWNGGVIPSKYSKLDIRKYKKYYRWFYYIHDDLGNRGMTPSDVGDLYYYKFKLSLGDGFHMYEMGNGRKDINGKTLVDKALVAATKDIGIVQRWSVTYDTPFSDKDGTVRKVDFKLINLKNEKDNKEILTPDDINTVSNRQYTAPKQPITLEILTPKNKKGFLTDGKGNVLIKFKANTTKASGTILDNKIDKFVVNINLQTNAMSEGENIYSKIIKDNIELKVEDGKKWYYFTLRVPVKTLMDKITVDKKLFKVSIVAQDTALNQMEKKVTGIKLDNQPPVVNDIIISNKDLKSNLVQSIKEIENKTSDSDDKWRKYFNIKSSKVKIRIVAEDRSQTGTGSGIKYFAVGLDKNIKRDIDWENKKDGNGSSITRVDWNNIYSGITGKITTFGAIRNICNDNSNFYEDGEHKLKFVLTDSVYNTTPIPDAEVEYVYDTKEPVINGIDTIWQEKGSSYKKVKTTTNGGIKYFLSSDKIKILLDATDKGSGIAQIKLKFIKDANEINTNWKTYKPTEGGYIDLPSGVTEGEYSIEAQVRDRASNESAWIEIIKNIIYDKTPPVINQINVKNINIYNLWNTDTGDTTIATNKSTFTSNTTNIVKIYGKTGNDIKITADVVEANLSQDNTLAKLGTTSKEWSSKTGGTDNNYTITWGNDTISSNNLKLVSGETKLIVTVEDLAGNKTSVEIPIVIDDTPPSNFTINTLNGVVYSTTAQAIRTKTPGFTINASADDESGVEGFVFWGNYDGSKSDLPRLDSAHIVNDDFKIYNISLTKNDNTYTGDLSEVYSPSDGYYQSKKVENTTENAFVAIDKAGNISYFNKKAELYVDTKPPSITSFSAIKVVDKNGFNPIINPKYVKAGDEIKLTADVAEYAVQTKTVDYLGLLNNTTMNTVYTGTISTTPSTIQIGDNNSTDTTHIKVTDSGVHTSQVVVITFTVTDMAGNSTTVTKHINLDNTSPTISGAIQAIPEEAVNGWPGDASDVIKSETDPAYTTNSSAYMGVLRNGATWSPDTTGFIGKANSTNPIGGVFVTTTSSISAFDNTYNAFEVSGLVDNQNNGNDVYVWAVDKAGNISASYIYDTIVVDTIVGSENPILIGSATIEPSSSTNNSYTYKMPIDLSVITEQAGVYKISGITLKGTTTDGITTSVAISINGGLEVSTTPSSTPVADSIIPEKFATFTLANNSRLFGQTVTFSIDVYDNLGNKATYTRKYLISKIIQTDIKAKSKNEKREINVNVETTGGSQITGREEAGGN